ncbi:MAG: SDH family Clp fold serine proteinase [Candidatus Heimdallarchaeaceae archaeon]
MPTWSEILKEIQEEIQKTQKPSIDKIRRKYLQALYEYTNRNVILYASSWTQDKADISPRTISITEEDIQGFMEVVHGLKGDELDLILHSPGGSAEAVETIVDYLRKRFRYIRVIIPQGAMSAATMLACAADEIVMGKHSYIGPIDSQIIIPTPLGLQSIPAQAILDQFEKAKEECQKDQKNLSIWLPILGQYGPALLIQCQNALNLSIELVSNFLQQYMFKDGDESRRKKAEEIAKRLANHSIFKSHGRHISRDATKDLGLTISNLEDDQKLQDLVLSVFHATTHTFSSTAATKIIENQDGRAFIKLEAKIPVQFVKGKKNEKNQILKLPEELQNSF